MEVLIIEMVERFGYIGIILLIALENIFPPIPSEVILTFGGFLTTYTKLNVWGVILSATIGSVAGAIVLYIVGRCLTGERLMQLVDGKPWANGCILTGMMWNIHWNGLQRKVIRLFFSAAVFPFSEV